MANIYRNLAAGLARQYGVGFDIVGLDEVGDDLGFEVAGDEVGADEVGDEVGDDLGADEVGDEFLGGPRRRNFNGMAFAQRAANNARAAQRRPAQRPRVLVARPRGPMASAAPPAPRDMYGQVYSGAMREMGGQIPETSIVNHEATYADGVAVRIEMIAPQPFTLTGLTFDNNTTSTNALRQATLTIGGLPVGGLPYLSVGRFTNDGTRNRLPPVEVHAGTPIVFSGVAHAVSPATDIYLIVDVLGIPIVRGNRMASRN